MNGGGQDQTWYAVREGGTYRILAAPRQTDAVARLALQLANEGKTAEAKDVLAGKVSEPRSGESADASGRQGSRDGLMHTMAAVEVEHGHTSEARDVILQRMTALGFRNA